MRKAVVMIATLHEAAHLGKHLGFLTLTAKFVVVDSSW